MASKVVPLHPPRLGAAAVMDWRGALVGARRRRLRVWLASGAALTVLIVVLGGITRLTQAGLPPVDWNAAVGLVPPLDEAGWREAWQRARGTGGLPELSRELTLPVFKRLFVWEYLHQLSARLIGVVFVVPFLIFRARGYFSPPLLRRVLVLFGLGALQGGVGWYLGWSGLADDPHLGHYRLAVHLGLALCIFALCLWLWRELGERPRTRSAPAATTWVGGLGALLAVQVVWGAFVAGLDAGLLYNTFPLMDGRLLPPGGTRLQPPLLNLVENPVTVQWVHRVLGTLLAVAAVGAALRLRRAPDAATRRLSAGFAGLVVGQYALGVLTLVNRVPVTLGALHQAGAVAVLGVWVVWLHHARHSAAAGPGREE